MSETTMTETRLRQLLDCYGARAERWPREERAAALALLEARPALAAERARAAELDTLLAQAARPAPSAALVGRLLEAAPRARGRPLERWLADLWPFGPAWQPACALAVALLLGLASGPLLPQADATQAARQDTEEIAVLLATASYAEEEL